MTFRTFHLGVFVVSTCIFPFLLSGQASFQRSIVMGDSLCIGTSIAELKNGTIAIAGLLAKDAASPGVEAAVWFLEADGTPIKGVRLPDIGSSSVMDIEAATDGGLMVLMENTPAIGQSASKIIKLDSLGTVEWTKRINYGASYLLTDISQTSGGYLVKGLTLTTNSGILAKLSEDGNFLWSKQLAGVVFQSERHATDGQGNLYVVGRADLQGVLVKVEPQNGNLLQVRAYGSLSGANAFTLRSCLRIPQQDSLVLIGDDVMGRLVFLKTNLDGVPASVRAIDVNNDPVYAFDAFVAAANELYIGIGGTGARGALLARLDGSLSLNWVKTYGGPSTGDFNLYALQHSTMPGSGILMAGEQIQNGNTRGYFVKTDRVGNIEGACCAMTIDVVTSVPTISHQMIAPVVEETPVLIDLSLQAQNRMFTSELICKMEEQIQLSDSILCPGECLLASMKGSQSDINYSWVFPGASPANSTSVNPGEVCFTVKGDYPVTLSTEKGCPIDTALVTVSNDLDRFPNAFTPDGDGTNDIFKPLVYCPVEEYRMQVFNRWGEQVFESFEVNVGWDGTFNGEQAPVDVYVYRVQYYAIREGVRTLVMNEKREVTLLR